MAATTDIEISDSVLANAIRDYLNRGWESPRCLIGVNHVDWFLEYHTQPHARAAAAWWNRQARLYETARDYELVPAAVLDVEGPGDLAHNVAVMRRIATELDRRADRCSPAATSQRSQRL